MGDYLVQRIASESGMKSCRRPMKVGCYDGAVDKTFVSWMGDESDAYVAAYDHSSVEWSNPKRVGRSHHDYHNYPHLVQTADGHLHVFHGCHNSPLRQATSPEPRSIRGDWVDREVNAAPNATYPMPVIDEHDDVFVFYRHTATDSDCDTDDRPLRYIRSTDGATTWRNSTDLTGKSYALGHTDRPDNLDEVYAGQIRRFSPTDDHSTEFHFVWTLAGGGREGNDHDRYHRNVYHAIFRPDNLGFRSIDGTDLGAWCDREASENYCKVLDTGSPDGLDVDYIQFVHVTDSGRPLLIFGTSDGPYAATYRDSEWTRVHEPFPEVDDPIGEFQDLEKTGPQAFRFYTSTVGGLRTFVTDDGGLTWSLDESIDFSNSVRNAVVIEDYREPIRLLATEATNWESMATDRDVYVAGRSPSPAGGDLKADQ